MILTWVSLLRKVLFGSSSVMVSWYSLSATALTHDWVWV